MKENTLFSVCLYIDFALILVCYITIARKQQQTKQEGMDMKNIWNIVHDCDGENGEPTCWAKEINHPKYGKFVWITENENCLYDVEVNRVEFITLVTCKTLTSAKRWVSKNL